MIISNKEYNAFYKIFFHGHKLLMNYYLYKMKISWCAERSDKLIVGIIKNSYPIEL